MQRNTANCSGIVQCVLLSIRRAPHVVRASRASVRVQDEDACGRTARFNGAVPMASSDSLIP